MSKQVNREELLATVMPLIMYRCVCNTDGCNHSYLEGAVRSGGVEVAGAALITGVMALLLARL